jgi:ribose 5-phosphate isomerase A
VVKSASSNSELKKAVGYAAAELVKDGTIVGIGTGSTVAFFIEALGKKVKEGMRLSGVPTSFQSRQLCAKNGILLLDTSMVDHIDITVDGADEVDANLNAIKGGGAAQTIEKIIASMADEFVLIIDQSKQVNALTQTFPLPVEVIPAAAAYFEKKASELGADVKLRMGVNKDGPVITDNSNFNFDCFFKNPPNAIELDRQLHAIPGVVETGFFLNIASKALVAGKDGIKIINKQEK